MLDLDASSWLFYTILTHLFYSLYFLLILIWGGCGLPYGIFSFRYTVFSVSHVGIMIICVSHPEFFLFLGLFFAHLETESTGFRNLMAIVKCGEDGKSPC